jgi:Pyridine nucleotide-disulphide oxidoreductase
MKESAFSRLPSHRTAYAASRTNGMRGLECYLLGLTTLRHAMHEIAALHPRDGYNRALESNVHPRDWINPKPTGRYNLIVVGAGTAGLIIATGAAGWELRFALIERALLGGDCLNVGCVPSKGLLSTARRAAAVRVFERRKTSLSEENE